MDASTLSALIDASSAELETLHARLGSPPEEIEKAMAALKTCIHDAVHAQLQLVQASVSRVEEQCKEYKDVIHHLIRATGCESVEEEDENEPLISRAEHLQAEKNRLERVYKAQQEQCAVVLDQIQTLSLCMSNAAGDPPASSSRNGPYEDVTSTRLQQLEHHWQQVQQLYTTRKLEMESQLTEILQLWAELHILPKVSLAEPDSLQAATDDDQARFECAILRYTQQWPVLENGLFHGEFQPLESPDTTTNAKTDLLQPTDSVLEQCSLLRAQLEQEKTQRESDIQTFYDELCDLWMRFDVPDEEMDAFVLEHRGSTLDVVHAYKEELDKMRTLKSQHMTLFIDKIREQIWEQWDALFMSEQERQTTFPEYFLRLPDSETTTDFDYDHILTQHEQMCARLTEMLEQRAPLLALIERYREICQEAKALEESAQDGSRLLGRNNRGDPGRLLREEKMRKRVKIQKPKMEQELLRVIPAWEEEHAMPFLMEGQRYVDHLEEQLESAKENTKQVPRQRPADTTLSHNASTASKRPASRPLSRAAPTPTVTRPASRAAVPTRPRTAMKTNANHTRDPVVTPHPQTVSTPYAQRGARSTASASSRGSTLSDTTHF
ncbi:putative protein kinase YGL059W [Malassezia yamatoensis]|uniref:Anaphase spindle elongation protein 1 n=1 Tax=Malassezia yamatoensis TaxID=253288 RepID=A0AAJ5YQ02_9BASI|nr:putative protein kinase YGL059W [Malassezia yamatoensis]